MWIRVDLDETPSVIEIQDLDDFGSFKVVANGPEDCFPEASSRLGRLEGDHVFVDVEVLLHFAADRSSDPLWKEQFDEMANYAQSHGWTDDLGRIRAHVEWSGPAGTGPLRP